MQTDLILIKKDIVPADVFVNGGIDSIISEIKKQALDMVCGLHVETAAGRKLYASAAYKVAQSKVVIDNLGKSLVAEWKAQSKKVDEVRKFARDTLDALAEEIRKPLTDYEESEAKRIEQEKLEKEISLAWDEAHIVHDLYLRQKAIEAKELELAKIEAEKKAKEAAELAEAQRIEREARIAKEAKEEAERKAKAAIEKAEKERIAAIERAKIEAELAEKRAKDAMEMAIIEERRKIEAEIKRKQDEELSLKAEAERASARTEHRRKINQEIIGVMESLGIENSAAKNLLSAIVKGKIPHIKIEY